MTTEVINNFGNRFSAVYEAGTRNSIWNPQDQSRFEHIDRLLSEVQQLIFWLVLQEEDSRDEIEHNHTVSNIATYYTRPVANTTPF